MSPPLPIPVGWKVIVQPKIAKAMSEGGIALDATLDAEEHLVYVGTIVAIGEAAFTTKTAGGLDLSQWKVRPDVGDHVIFSRYSGLKINQRGSDQPLILMNDTDIHAVVDSPDDYFAWVDA